MSVEVLVYRRTAGMEFERLLMVTVKRIADVADAYAIELGFPSWEQYSEWCESPPILHTVRVLKS